MQLIFLCISTVLTIFFPIISLPANLLGVLFSKGKIKKKYAFLLAFSLAILAYIWIPGREMDLYRHHKQMSQFIDFNVENLFLYIRSDLEPLNYLIKFFVAQTGNYNLLQFIVVLIGYFELFWVLSDLAETKKIKGSIFALTLLYIFSSVRFIDFASGLRFFFATINIGTGVYLMYFRRTKILHYLLFVTAASMHVTTLLAIIIILVFSKWKIFDNIKPPSLSILVVTTMLFGFMVLAMNNIFGANGNELMKIFNEKYDSYFSVGTFESTSKLHIGLNLLFPILNTLFCLFISAFVYKKTKYRKYCSFILYLSVWVLIMTLTSGIFMRYGFMLVMISSPIISETLSILDQEKSKNIILVIMMIALTLSQLGRSFAQISYAKLPEQVDNNLTKDVFYLMEH